MKKKAKATKAVIRSKFPTFEVPPGTPMIPGNLVQKILEEEDLEELKKAIRLRGK
jgi:hypothetical protein